MRLAYKLALLLALASAGPLLLSTGITVPRAAADLQAQLDALYQATAVSLARELEARLDGSANAVGSFARSVDFAELAREEDAEQEALLRSLGILAAQTPSATWAALVDADGAAITAPVRGPHARGDGANEDAGLSAFASHAPFREVVQTGGVVIGPPYASPADGFPRVVVGAQARAPEGEAWVVLVELSLSGVVAQLDATRIGETGAAHLLDGRGEVVWQGARAAAAGERIEARARLGSTGWEVVVSQDGREALAAVQRQYQEAAVWAAVGLLLAAVLAFTAVRVVTRPLGALESAARRVEGGDLEAHVPLRGNDELARVGRAFNGMMQGLRERARLHQSFKRYLSGAVAERILRESSDLEVEGEQVEVTILFLDVRGFTRLSEQLAPKQVVELLNAYFERIVEVATRHEGVVMKFIGDAVMVMYGVPRVLPDPEARAVRTALEVQEALGALNQRRQAEGLPVAGIGAGINTGPAVIGNVGSSQRMEYTAIGDAVNLAERMQGLAAAGEVVVSATTLSRLGEGVVSEARGQVQVKGKAQPVEVHRVLALAPSLAPAPQTERSA